MIGWYFIIMIAILALLVAVFFICLWLDEKTNIEFPTGFLNKFLATLFATLFTVGVSTIVLAVLEMLIELGVPLVG